MKKALNDNTLADALNAEFHAEVERVAAMSNDEVESGLRRMGVEPARALPAHIHELLATRRRELQSSASDSQAVRTASANVVWQLLFVTGCLLIILGGVNYVVMISDKPQVPEQGVRELVEIHSPGAYRGDQNNEAIAEAVAAAMSRSRQSEEEVLHRPVQRTTIPEPTTMLLLGTGLAGIAARVRRRRRRCRFVNEELTE